MMMLRKMIVAVVAILGVGLTAAPRAAAVSFATPDTTNRYPYVGTLVLRFGEPGAYTYHYWCSGTLVARSAEQPSTAVGMVANGHCFDVALQQSYFPGSTLIGMTLQPVVGTSQPPSAVYPGVGHIYGGYPRLSDDVGVFSLSGAVSVGRNLPRLPAAGELSAMDVAGELIGSVATIVGYGIERTSTGGRNGLVLTDTGVRRYATETVTALSSDYVHLQSISAQGQSGPCSGDSGAPRLFDDDTLLGAITGFVGGQCQSPEKAIRLDRPDLLDFVRQYIR